MEIAEKFKSSKVHRSIPKEDKPTMTNRILPKRDFEKVVEHDKIYLGILNEVLEFAIIKQDILGKKAQKILATQTKESITNNIDVLVEWADIKLKCLDTKAKIVIQEKLLTDKTNHYEQVFMPQWEKEKAETIKNFDKAEKEARNLIKTKPELSEEVCSKIEDELHWFDALKKEQKGEVEYQWQLYKPLKRLLKHYQNLMVKKTTIGG